MPTTFAPTSSPTAVPTIYVDGMRAAQGFAIEGYKYSSTIISGGGDVDGDHLNDLLISNYGINGSSSKFFLVRGRKGDVSKINFSNNSVDQVSYITISSAGQYAISSSLMVSNPSGAGISDMLITEAFDIYIIPGKTDIPCTINLPGLYSVIKAPITSFAIDVPILYNAEDLNGDGQADVAIKQPIATLDGPFLSRVFILWWKSGGLTTLQMPPSGGDGFTIDVYNPGSDITNIAMVQGIADVTGDGVSDLGIVVYTSTASTLYILPGKMGGYTGIVYINGPSAEPSLITVISTGSASWPSFASGDFDGDGHNDLAVGGIFNYTNYAPTSGVVKLFQGGVGAFNATHHIGKQVSILPDSNTNCNGYSVVTADIDRDGRDDIGFSSPCSNIGGIPYSGVAYFIPSGPDIFSTNILMPVPKMISVIGSSYSAIGQQMVIAGNMHGDDRIAVAISSQFTSNVYVVYFDGFPAADASTAPSHAPTVPTTHTPSMVPSNFPIISPTILPTAHPTVAPTHTPTVALTKAPNIVSTHTLTPTLTPTESPAAPSQSPSFQPTESPYVHDHAVPTTDYNTGLIIVGVLAVTAMVIGVGGAYYYHQYGFLPETSAVSGEDHFDL